MTTHTQRLPFSDISTSQPHVNPNRVVDKRIMAVKGIDASHGQQIRGSKVVLATSPMQNKMRSPMQGKTPADMKRASKKSMQQSDMNVGTLRFRGNDFNVHSDFDLPPFAAASVPMPNSNQLPPAQSSNAQKSSADAHEIVHSLAETSGVASAAHVKVLPFAPPAPRLGPLPPAFIPPFEHAAPLFQGPLSDTALAEVGARFSLFGIAPGNPAAKENLNANKPPQKAPVVLTAEQEAARAARQAQKEANKQKRQEALQRKLELEKLKAEEEARKEQERTDMIMSAIASVEEEVELEDVEPLREVKWEMVAVMQALAILQRLNQSLSGVDPEKVEAAMGQQTLHFEQETCLQDLHWQLLQLVKGGEERGGAAKRKSSALWKHALREWAEEEMGSDSPFIASSSSSSTAPGPQKKVAFQDNVDSEEEEEEEEEELEYEELSVEERVALLHALLGTALGASMPRDTNPGELRPELMGHDSKQRAYWLVEAGGGGAGWLLREEGGRQSKTRESLLSCDGTPGRCSSAGQGRSSMVGDRSSMDSSISSSGASLSGLDASLQRLSVGDATSSSSSSSARSSSASFSAVAASLAPKHSRADEREEREEEGAPERGEEGENFYQHQQWTAQASRASGPAAAPTETVQLLAADGEGMAAVTKALFSSAEKRDKELAAVMAPRVLRALAVPQRRKVYGTRRAARPMRA